MQDQETIQKEVETLTGLLEGLPDQVVSVMIVMVKEGLEWTLQKPYKDPPSKVLAGFGNERQTALSHLAGFTDKELSRCPAMSHDSHYQQHS